MSPEAKDFIERLLCFDPHQRLGANGADEVKRHPFLQDIDWDSVRTMEASFVPQVADPESTDYFDARGAVAQVFDDDPLLQADEDSADASKLAEASVDGNASLSADVRKIQDRSETVPQDFGAFNFKNREVLKQANDDMIKKLRSEQLLPSPSESSSRYGQLARKVMPKSSSIGEGVRALSELSRGSTANYSLNRTLDLLRPPPRPLRLSALAFHDQAPLIRRSRSRQSVPDVPRRSRRAVVYCLKRQQAKMKKPTSLGATPCRADYAGHLSATIPIMVNCKTRKSDLRRRLGINGAERPAIPSTPQRLLSLRLPRCEQACRPFPQVTRSRRARQRWVRALLNLKRRWTA